MSRRDESDYTAWETQQRWGRLTMIEPLEMIPVDDVRLACEACCVTPDDHCICLTEGEDEFRAAMRRIRRLSADYRPDVA